MIKMQEIKRRSFLPLLCLSPAGAQTGFAAGAAKRNITPDPLLPVSGGMGAPVAATRKLGELMARALVVENGGTRLGVVSVDLIGFPSALGDRVRERVKRIPAENILIAATHTHSAPDAYAFPDGKGGHTASLAYLERVVGEVAAALDAAIDALAPAELRVGVGEAEGKIAYNYYAPDLYDRQLSALELRRRSGEAIATLVNYAIHPEVLGNQAGVVSPDLVWPLCEELEKAGGVALFVNGAQGGMVTADNRTLPAGPRDALRGYWPDERSWAECERIGGLLARETRRVLAGAAWQANPEVRVRARRVRFPVESEELWAVVQHSPLGYRREGERVISTQLNYAEIGTARVVTIPGEALPNIGLYLKRKLKAEHPFLFGLTNDAFGYILTEVDYQSFAAYRYVSRVSLGEKTAEILIGELLDLAGRGR